MGRRGLVAAIALAIAVAAPASASAATRYVTTSGSDSTDCTNNAAPCKTIMYAVSQATDGDVIQIGTGQFYEEVATSKVLTFVGAGAGHIEGLPAATIIQGPHGGTGEGGLPAMSLPNGGRVRSLRAIGGSGGQSSAVPGTGAEGVVFISSSASPAALRLEDAVAEGGDGGFNTTSGGLPGSAGRAILIRSDPGAVALSATGSDFAAGVGLGGGTAIWIDGSTASAGITNSRIPNRNAFGGGLFISDGAQVALDATDITAAGSGGAVSMYSGSLSISHSRLASEGGTLFASPSYPGEHAEVKIVDSLLASERAMALSVETEETASASVSILGSTLIAHSFGAAIAQRDESGGPTVITLRNSIARLLLPSGFPFPLADLLADGGTIVADFSNFSSRKEENGGTATAPGSGSNIAGAPGFIDENNGVYILKNNSPLIDRGDPSVVTAGEVDLLGSPRSLDGNRDCIAAPDMGAFEVTGLEAACPVKLVDQPPVVSGFAVTNKVFAPTGTPVKGKVKRGTRFTYKLSEAAHVVITILRKAPGRLVGKGAKARCVKVTAANRRRKACVRLLPATTLSADNGAGSQAITWNGRIHGKPAPAGAYRATIEAADSAGQKSQPQQVSFKVVR